jgi:predicted SAM-dependent methyltransferase
MGLKHSLGKRLIPRLPVSRRTFDILRFEGGCLWQRICNVLNPVYHRKLRALRSMREVSLNLGSGGRGLPGWINLDARPGHGDLYVAFDVRRRLPLRDGQVKRILAEHVIEHLDFRDDVPNVFRDFYRVLQPGGVARIIVPDAERFLHAYTNRSAPEFASLDWDLGHLPGDIFTPMHIINHIFHQGGEHLFGWDFETLQFMLGRAGFEQIVKQSYGVSSDPQLAIDQPNHRPYSLYVEAVKPERAGRAQ